MKGKRMKKVTCDKCHLERRDLWPVSLGMDHYDICWDCKPLIKAFIETNNDMTAGNARITNLKE